MTYWDSGFSCVSEQFFEEQLEERFAKEFCDHCITEQSGCKQVTAYVFFDGSSCIFVEGKCINWIKLKE